METNLRRKFLIIAANGLLIGILDGGVRMNKPVSPVSNGSDSETDNA